MSEIAMMEHHNYADWLIYLLAFLDELQSEAGLVKSITVHAPGWYRCTLASIHSVHLKLNVVLRQSRDRCELPLIDFALNWKQKNKTKKKKTNKTTALIRSGGV